MVTVFARRKLDTGDLTDYVIPLDTEFNIGYAYYGSASTLRKHTVSSTVAVTLNSDGTPLYGQMTSDGESTSEDTDSTNDDENGHDDEDGHDDDGHDHDGHDHDHEGQDHEDDAAFHALSTASLASFATILAILQ